MPHRLSRGALTGLLVGVGLLSLCALGPGGPGAPQRRVPVRTLGAIDRQPILPSREMPAPLRRAWSDVVAQGSGPDPDEHLTPEAISSQEFDAATPGLAKVARVALVSDGVDEWINAEQPAPGDPPGPPNDPNNVPDGLIDRYGLSATGFNIWLMRHDGSQQIQVTDLPGDERDPAYDPGATVLAFCNNRTGVYQIYTLDIVSKTVRQITQDAGNKTHPTWSADGTLIAYATDINGATNRDIHVIRTTGVGLPTPLVAMPADEFEPMWSPDGLWILYTRSDAGADHIWRVDSLGGNQEQLTNGGGDPSVNDRSPAWRQDGFSTQFAFASDRLTDITDQTKEFNIWTLGSSGEIAGQPAVVASNTDPSDTHDDILPAFSPLLTPNASPIRIFFTSYRMDKVGLPTPAAEPDIWALVIDDTRPPRLDALPSVSNRNPTPGSDIIIHVPVWDAETGVQSVFAWMKDPDSRYEDAQGRNHKIYRGGNPADPDHDRDPAEGGYGKDTEDIHPPGPTRCPIQYWEELDCHRVGSVELFDDGDLVNSGDDEAGDGIFSGIWTTPAVPSDFVMDIELTDYAGNFFNYDDIYGFSTVRFTPRSNVLFVDDYCEGQAFMAQLGFTDRVYAGYPCESYYTLNFSGGGADNTIADGSYGEDFDVWRVICRGAPDLTALTYYGPTSETQLTTDLTGLREVPVANRCIFWAAPHCGSGWNADGTLPEASTQALLRNFVGLGGRLAVAGMDVAWALTMEGQVPNTFLTDILGANFQADDNNGSNNRDFTQDINFDLFGVGGDPVADDTWSTAIHWTDPTTTALASGPGTDGSMHSPFPDIITPVGSSLVFSYGTSAGGPVAAVRKEDSQTGSRVVYFAFPYEALGRRYDGNCACRDKRHKLTHMTLCHLRTGGIQGRAVGVNYRPIVDPEPIVTVHLPNNPAILYAQRCQEDGTFVISGLPPERYEVRATRPGYKVDKPHDMWIHGGLAYPTQNFVLTVAQPGAIQGTVTSLSTGDPIANVTVKAVSNTDPLGGPDVPAVQTAADGTYVISDVPVGDYDVTADGSTATPPYGSDSAVVTVVPGGTVIQDFQLPAANGLLEVTVVSAQDGSLLANATIDARLNNVVVGSDSTDATGIATLDLPPGDYSVLADLPGYAQATKPATVLSAQTVSIQIQMTPLPPGSIAGQIYRATTPDQPLDGVEVRVIVGGTIVKRVNSQATWTYPGGSAPRHNYFVPDVPAGGRVEVRAFKPGFTVTPDQRVVQVASGVVTYNVNFTVSALHTFPAGLQFVSVPYDYSDQLPPDVLGVPAGQQLKMAVWDPSLARYALYPTAPADRLRLGVGFWLNPPQPQDLVSEGRRAGSPFLIPLGIGWNGIGNPFGKSIDFFSLKVRDSAGVVRPIQEAFGAGQVRNGLFAYGIGGYRLATTLAPYSGYWVYAEQAVSLVVEDPEATAATASAERSPRTALPKPNEGWLAPISVWSAGMNDESVAFGIAPDADRVLDVPKPPPPVTGAHLYCTFAGPDGAAQAVDVRPGGDQTWALDIHTTAERSPVTVTWPDLSQLPTTARPVLHDKVAGRKVYMRTSREYTYRPKGQADRRLEIEVTDAPQGLLVVTAAAAPQGDGGTFTYTLARDAQVTIQVLNIAGRVVAQPIAAKSVSAGRNVAVWNGQQHSGPLAPAGMYIVRIMARADDGQEAWALTALRVRR